MNGFFFFAVVAALAFLAALFAKPARIRQGGRVVAIASVGIGVFLLILGSFTIVGTRQIAIQTSFGRPSGQAFDNGLHLKAPWTVTHEMDGAIQIDVYKDHGNGDDQRIKVRLGNSSTADADVSIRWQIRQEAAPELFQNYKTFDNVRINLVERNLSVALNEVFAGYDPLAPQNLNVSPLPDLAKRAAAILREEVGKQVDVIDVNVPTIKYDQGTEDKINQLNQQRAQTAIAKEAQNTAIEQSKANAAIAASISNSPNVIVSNCITAAIAKAISPLGCWPGTAALPTVAVPGPPG